MSEDLASKIELLSMKIEILEAKLKQKEAELAVKEAELSKLREKLNEPAPLSREAPATEALSSQSVLNELTPGELIVLAKKKGIPLEKIFPL